VNEIKGACKIKGSSELINKSGWREIFWQGEVWKTQEYFVYFRWIDEKDPASAADDRFRVSPK